MYDKTNDVIFGNEAREKILEGLNKTADAVKVTLGARGRTALIQREFGLPNVTKDGVTVAKSINFRDSAMKSGSMLLKEAANQTNYEAGDGTTTATVLVQAMIKEGMKYLAAGHDPMQIKREMDKIAKVVVEEIEKSKKEITTDEEIYQIAKISANGDEEIASLISDALKKVGDDGVITIENSPDTNTFAKVEEGMGYDKGWISQYLVTNIERNEAILEDAIVLIYNGTVNSPEALIPVLTSANKTNKSVFMIANEIEDSVLHFIIQNKLQGKIRFCATKSPEIGQEKINILQDIAAYTGATVCGKNEGISLEKIGTNHLGGVRKVIVTKDQTTLVGGLGLKSNVSKRIDLVKKTMKETTSDHEKERLQKRLGRLSGGIGVLYIGAMTEIELKEKKDRVEDSLNATKAALLDGIVEGGGTCLAKISTKLNAENIGETIIKEAILSPMKQIVANAGGRVDVVINNLEKIGYGFDVISMDYVDNMYEAGIIDPAKVTKAAFLNAVSLAGIVLTMETAVIYDEEENVMPMNNGMM